jgi:hypothetical protein
MNNFQTIKKDKADKIDALIKETKMFFAFSNEQFATNKTELQEGEKYVSLGAGAYMPKSNVQKWIDGQKEIDNWAKNQVKESKQEEAQILYELRNYECFYTGDIEDAFDALKDSYTLEQIQAVFRKYRETEEQF